jgi:hypothetical protein
MEKVYVEPFFSTDVANFSDLIGKLQGAKPQNMTQLRNSKYNPYRDIRKTSVSSKICVVSHCFNGNVHYNYNEYNELYRLYFSALFASSQKVKVDALASLSSSYGHIIFNDIECTIFLDLAHYVDLDVTSAQIMAEFSSIFYFIKCIERGRYYDKNPIVFSDISLEALLDSSLLLKGLIGVYSHFSAQGLKVNMVSDTILEIKFSFKPNLGYNEFMASLVLNHILLLVVSKLINSNSTLDSEIRFMFLDSKWSYMLNTIAAAIFGHWLKSFEFLLVNEEKIYNNPVVARGCLNSDLNVLLDTPKKIKANVKRIRKLFFKVTLLTLNFSWFLFLNLSSFNITPSRRNTNYFSFNQYLKYPNYTIKFLLFNEQSCKLLAIYVSKDKLLGSILLPDDPMDVFHTLNKISTLQMNYLLQQTSYQESWYGILDMNTFIKCLVPLHGYFKSTLLYRDLFSTVNVRAVIESPVLTSSVLTSLTPEFTNISPVYKYDVNKAHFGVVTGKLDNPFFPNNTTLGLSKPFYTDSWDDRSLRGFHLLEINLSGLDKFELYSLRLFAQRIEEGVELVFDRRITGIAIDEVSETGSVFSFVLTSSYVEYLESLPILSGRIFIVDNLLFEESNNLNDNFKFLLELQSSGVSDELIGRGILKEATNKLWGKLTAYSVCADFDKLSLKLIKEVKSILSNFNFFPDNTVLTREIKLYLSDFYGNVMSADNSRSELAYTKWDSSMYVHSIDNNTIRRLEYKSYREYQVEIAKYVYFLLDRLGISGISSMSEDIQSDLDVGNVLSVLTYEKYKSQFANTTIISNKDGYLVNIFPEPNTPEASVALFEEIYALLIDNLLFVNNSTEEQLPVHIYSQIVANLKVYMLNMLRYLENNDYQVYRTATDSIVVDKKLPDSMVDSTQVGRFKLEEIYHYVIFYNPINYVTFGESINWLFFSTIDKAQGTLFIGTSGQIQFNNAPNLFFTFTDTYSNQHMLFTCFHDNYFNKEHYNIFYNILITGYFLNLSFSYYIDLGQDRLTEIRIADLIMKKAPIEDFKLNSNFMTNPNFIYDKGAYRHSVDNSIIGLPACRSSLEAWDQCKLYPVSVDTKFDPLTFLSTDFLGPNYKLNDKFNIANVNSLNFIKFISMVPPSYFVKDERLFNLLFQNRSFVDLTFMVQEWNVKSEMKKVKCYSLSTGLPAEESGTRTLYMPVEIMGTPVENIQICTLLNMYGYLFIELSQDDDIESVNEDNIPVTTYRYDFNMYHFFWIYFLNRRKWTLPLSPSPKEE